MDEKLTAKVLKRLETERNIWMATIRPQKREGDPIRPHLVPVWFAWSHEKIYLCIESKSVKGRNLKHNPLIALSLEDGSNVVICEGTAERVEKDDFPLVREIMFKKFNWRIEEDDQYDMLVEVTPKKWLVWGD